MDEFLRTYFVETGFGWATIGGLLLAMFGCIGSAKGLRISCSQGAGVLSEKPELFGRLLVIMALPGSQGIYGFVGAILLAGFSGILGGKVALSPLAGVGLCAVGITVGLVYWRSAIFQGETAAAAINLVARRPEATGRAIILPALVETYALFALLVSVMFMGWLCSKDLQVVVAAAGQ